MNINGDWEHQVWVRPPDSFPQVRTKQVSIRRWLGRWWEDKRHNRDVCLFTQQVPLLAYAVGQGHIPALATLSTGHNAPRAWGDARKPAREAT